MPYQVKDWDVHYENNKSRERKECSYVCVPNSQDGLGFSRIMAQRDGAAIYGIWCLLLGALSRQKRVDGKGREGWLTNNGHAAGTEWAPNDLALLWRRNQAEITRAIEVLSSPAIGWIVSTDSTVSSIVTLDGHHAGTECPSSASERKKEENRKKEGVAAQPLPFSSPPFVSAWNDWIEHLSQKKKKPTEIAIRNQLEGCKEWGEQRSIAALKHSAKNNYQGLFEPSGSPQAHEKRPALIPSGPPPWMPQVDRLRRIIAGLEDLSPVAIRAQVDMLPKTFWELLTFDEKNSLKRLMREAKE